MSVKPLDTGGGGGNVGLQDGLGGVGGVSYASKVGGGMDGKARRARTKLNVLDIYLERRSNDINFNLSKEELSKLVFKKMRIQAKQVIKIDTSAFGKIHIELDKIVKPTLKQKTPCLLLYLCNSYENSPTLNSEK